MQRITREILLDNMRSCPDNFFGNASWIRVLPEGEALYIHENEQMPETLPPGIDIDTVRLSDGKFNFVTTGDLGDLGKEMVAAVPPADMKLDTWRMGSAPTTAFFFAQKGMDTTTVDLTNLDKGFKIVFNEAYEPQVLGSENGAPKRLNFAA